MSDTPYEVNSAGEIVVGATVPAIVLTNPDYPDSEWVAQVIDRHPELKDFHYEGRRIVEVSVEAFVALAGFAGWVPKQNNQEDTSHATTKD